MKALLPFQSKGALSFLRSLLFPAGLSGLAGLLLYDTDAAVNKPRAAILPFAAANAVMLLILFLTQTVFGEPLSARLAYPFFALIKSTDSFSNFEHFESLVSGIWIIMSLCFFAVLLKMAGELFLSLVSCARQKREWGRLLPGAAVLALVLLFNTNGQRALNAAMLGTVLPAGLLVLLVLFPAAALLLKPKKQIVVLKEQDQTPSAEE